MRLRGITVTLIDKRQIGLDGFNAPVYEPIEIDVENVLISPASISATPEELNFNGKTAEYILAIPKGDTHDWENKEVIFFGERWITVGNVEQGIEAMIPLEWHKKIRCARYE